MCSTKTDVVCTVSSVRKTSHDQAYRRRDSEDARAGAGSRTARTLCTRRNDDGAGGRPIGGWRVYKETRQAP